MHPLRLAALVGPLALAAPAAAQTYDPPEDVVGRETDLQDRYVALNEEYQEALYAWYDELDAVQEANAEGADEPWPESPDGAFYPRFRVLADEGHVAARLWCLENFQFSEVPDERRRVTKLRSYLELIDAAHDAHGRELVQALLNEASGWSSSGLGRDLAFLLLDELAAVAADADLSARVLHAKASVLEWSEEEGTWELAVEQYERLVDEHPDHELAARAKGKLFAAENLQVGLQVPDIVGTNVDGETLKLSDHDGKVRVIGFWGFW